MKHSLILLFIGWTTLILAQKNQENEVHLKSRFRPGLFWNFTGFKPAKEGKGQKYDRLIFDLTYNDWIGERGPFKVKGPSMGMNVAFMFDIPMNKKGTASFGIGPQYGFFNIRHDLAYAFDFDQKTTLFDEQIHAGETGFTKVVGNYFQMPVEFRFRTKGWKHFKVHIGGKVGYLFAFNHKTKWTDNGGDYIQRDYSTPDLNRLLYSAHIRLGMRNWAVYASYQINPMFKGAQSTKLNPFQLGLSISLF